MSPLRYSMRAGPGRHLAWRDTDTWLPQALAPLVVPDRIYQP
jgi:hypothetical protein